MNLREYAAGKDCLVRIEGLCNWNVETTALAHIRRAHCGGISLKPSDFVAVRACSACHDEIDRRTRFLNLEQLNDYILDALCRQYAEYDRENVLKVAI